MNADVSKALVDVFPQVIPECILGVAACFLFLGGTVRANRNLWAAVALVALAGAGLVLFLESRGGDRGITPAALFAAPVLADPLAVFIKFVALVGGAVLVLLSWNHVDDRQAAEYHGCLLFITAGLSLTGSANELITLFLALELISIPTYVLLYLPRYDDAAQEAAMKYFLLSVFSSALLLFGFSYLYGLIGTTNLPAITQALSQTRYDSLPAIALVALIMVVAGLGFRITAVPFHFYAPDVYQGAPTAGAALLAFVPKVAGFVALMRVLGLVPAVLADNTSGPGAGLGGQLPFLLWILAAVTMTIGNVLALLQDNVKRLLAYSSVAHAGYMLIGLAAAPYLRPAGSSPSVLGGVESVLFYLVAYGAMTIGAFAVLAYLSTRARQVETVEDLAGLSRSHPGIAVLMSLFMFSLIGIPLTAGFAGKLLLFLGALAVPSVPGDLFSLHQARLFRILALIGVVNAAIGGWYYLRIIAVMYLRSSIRPIVTQRSWAGLATLWMCAIVTLGGGVYPWPLFRMASVAVTRVTPAQTAQP